MYLKAGRRVAEPGGEEQTPAEPLQLSIKHATPVFGTDFDVIVEVGGAAVPAQVAQVGLLMSESSVCVRR